ncbi:putative E3 ubiquitin-protein ligase RING1a/b [Helianthus annuus]|nr:putative E3 ubiquitin-protein ligase RING1a/b [Helianthus annuus]
MRRSQSSARNLRGRRRKSAEPRDSDNEVDADNDNGGNYSSSSDEPEPSTDVEPKRYKRWGAGRTSSLPSSSGANGRCDDNETDRSRKMVGASVGLVGSLEILAWACAGMRSHTRYGAQSSGGKSARNTHNSKLIHRFKRLPQNDYEMIFSLKCIYLLQTNHANVCQYVDNENGLRADEIELLLVKGGCFDADS